MHWLWVALAYLVYLSGASFARPEFAPIRPRVAAGAACLAVMALVPALPAVARVPFSIIVPSLILLFGYRLSGLFFVRVDSAVEAGLLRMDHRLLIETGLLPSIRRAPRVLEDFLEMTYLLVYAALPAGAVILAVSGHRASIDAYWTVVLTAEFLCYGVLPWIQTRPPMLVEAESRAMTARGVRRLNQAIAARASIHANTIPSGHAAGAFAAGLAIASVMTGAGVVFLLLALSIATASVVGRYHYLLDSVLGGLVAVAAWLGVAALMR